MSATWFFLPNWISVEQLIRLKTQTRCWPVWVIAFKQDNQFRQRHNMMGTPQCNWHRQNISGRQIFQEALHDVKSLHYCLPQAQHCNATQLQSCSFISYEQEQRGMPERRSRSASHFLDPPSVNQNDQVKGRGKSRGMLHPLGTRSNPNL